LANNASAKPPSAIGSVNPAMEGGNERFTQYPRAKEN
jgi:hypothetical protein